QAVAGAQAAAQAVSDEAAGASAEPPRLPPESTATTDTEQCETCQRILNIVGDGGAQNAHVAEALGIDTAESSKRLRELAEAGRLRRTGFGRGTRYSSV